MVLRGFSLQDAGGKEGPGPLHHWGSDGDAEVLREVHPGLGGIILESEAGFPNFAGEAPSFRLLHQGDGGVSDGEFAAGGFEVAKSGGQLPQFAANNLAPGELLLPGGQAQGVGRTDGRAAGPAVGGDGGGPGSGDGAQAAKQGVGFPAAREGIQKE